MNVRNVGQWELQNYERRVFYKTIMYSICKKQNKSIIIYTDDDCVRAVSVLADMAFRCTEQHVKQSDLVSLHPGPCEQTAESSSKHTRPRSDPRLTLADTRHLLAKEGIVSLSENKSYSFFLEQRLKAEV